MSHSEISLRPAGTADWPVIASLLEQNKLPLEGAQDHLHTYLLALDGADLVGIAGAEVYGDVALLRSIAVAPSLQRSGIGKLLVGRMLDEARRRQVRKVFLLTVTAPEYFAQFGFKRGPRDKAPSALQASAEFQGACPACAAFMSLTLHEDPKSSLEHLPVAVLGAGPAGLAAVAKLLEREIPVVVVEAGARVGSNLLDYGHVRLFSPWRYNIDPTMAGMLEASGWKRPPDEVLPLAGEVVDGVLQPFAELPAVSGALRLNTTVRSVSREGFDKVKSVGRDKAPFLVEVQSGGKTETIRARAVIDATGTWNTPNPLGANGLPVAGEIELRDAIFYGIPDVLGAHRSRYVGKRTLVVGAGHSAANTLLALAELAANEPGTRLAWAVRSPSLTRVFGGGAADALPARGQLGTTLKRLRDEGKLEFFAGLRVTGLARSGEAIAVTALDAAGETVSLDGFDEIVCATGQRPQLSVTSELRLKLDPWLESTEALGPLIDPNLHSCGTVRPHGHRELSHPEPGFYTLGVKSYGRAPTFLMATGFEQARSIVAAIAGDLEAADRVELDLPETGVCSLDAVDQADSGSNCCGTPAPQVTPVSLPVSAATAGGCGPTSCGTTKPAPAKSKTACCG